MLTILENSLGVWSRGIRIGGLRGVVQMTLNAVLYGTAAVLLRLFGFAVFLWLARSLPIKEYAAWGMLYALQVAITSFSIAGIVESVIGLLGAEGTECGRKVLYSSANTVFGIAAAPVAVGLITLFLAVGGMESVPPMAVLYTCISGASLAYAAMQAQIVRLDESHTASLYFNFVVPLAGYFGAGAMFWASGTVESYFLGSCIGSMTSLAAALVFNLGHYSVSRSLVVCKPILLRVSPFIVVTFVGWLSGYGNNYIIKLMLHAKDIASFTLLFNLASIMQLVATSTNQVWSPRFYRIVHERPLAVSESQNLLFFEAQSIALGITGAALVGLYPIALGILGGNLVHYADMRVQLFLLVAGYMLLVPTWHAQNYFLSFDMGRAMMKIHVVSGIAGIAAVVGMMAFLGSLGVYIGFAFQALLRSAALAWGARRRWPVGLPWKGIAGGMVISSLPLLISALFIPG